MVAPFCLMYMCAAYVLYVHQLIFTYVKSIDTVGELWPWTFTRIVTCLIIGQVRATWRARRGAAIATRSPCS